VAKDPFDQFTVWFEQAKAAEPADHDAASLASATSGGRPSLRMILMRGYDERGFTFYTNLESRKSRELAANPYAAMCFHWKSTARQIRIEGSVQQVSDEEADAYYETRPRESQIGAWASKQSQILEGRLTLERKVAKYAAKFALGKVPRPEFWSGYRLIPDCFEFWDKRPFRLHERTLYTKDDLEWTSVKLYP